MTDYSVSLVHSMQVVIYMQYFSVSHFEARYLGNCELCWWCYHIEFCWFNSFQLQVCGAKGGIGSVETL